MSGLIDLVLTLSVVTTDAHAKHQTTNAENSPIAEERHRDSFLRVTPTRKYRESFPVGAIRERREIVCGMSD